MSWFGFLVSFLAAYRIARVVTTDTISAPWRERLYTFAYNDAEPIQQGVGKEAVYVASPRAPWRTWAYELLTCPLCIGFWISAGVYSAYRWSDSTAVRAVIVVFAVAGAQCLLVLFAEGD